MSNPSGTDHDPQSYDADPVTEVIDIPGEVAQADPATGERRYTAPGFDAGSTQIIDRVPGVIDRVPGADGGAPTEFIMAGPGGRRAPQSIPGRRSRRGGLWRPAAVLLGVGLIAAAIAGAVALKNNSARASEERRVRTSIETFDTAIREGDLATLRSITCGQTRENYVRYDDQSWTDTYAKVMAAKQYPVVASVDQIVVNGDHAEANVTSYMAYDPNTTSKRSFDLQFRDDQWKICQAS